MQESKPSAGDVNLHFSHSSSQNSINQSWKEQSKVMLMSQADQLIEEESKDSSFVVIKDGGLATVTE